ncbi:Sodium channel protein Nach [Dufourea novaeangliae]|uniref:Sodium channel protein Nach n=1 Tax=Dufourea novaeangliae TaxID=178035 RepID=A0A154P7B7_DUFNO|nr:Sodium channel protein Nach [Dufourea novaeangliae]
MPKISTNASAKSGPRENNYFYDDEILPDLQARRKARLNVLNSVPADVPKEIGMRTITVKSNAGKYFVEFSSGSTIHGFKHFVAPNRHPIERFLAVLFVVGALVCLVFLSVLFWNRYQNDATVITLNNDSERFKIYKPAMFICPMPNVDESKIPQAFEKHGIERTPEAEQFFTFLSYVNYAEMDKTPDFDKVPSNKWLEILHDIRRDIPPINTKEPDPYEAWVVTENGICLAKRNVFAVYATYKTPKRQQLVADILQFISKANDLGENLITACNRADLSAKEGVKEKLPNLYWISNNWTTVPIPDEVPFYNRDNDRTLETVAMQNEALFAMCDPFETLSFGGQTKLIQLRMVQRLIMSISEIKTKSNVKELHVHQRKCKFVTDGGLKTWPVYTRNMCTIECRMRVIEKRCNCRPHFARPIGGVNVCNARQLRCIGNITKDLFLSDNPPPFCNCLPNCNLIRYQMADSGGTSTLNVPTSSTSISLIIDFPKIVYYRSLLYGFTGFLTSVGGAAGLFLGASVLSFVEIFYYATFHVCFYAKRVKEKNNKMYKVPLHD